jgi:hypothetical protein
MLLEVNDKIGLSEKASEVLIPGVVDILSGKESNNFTRVI